MTKVKLSVRINPALKDAIERLAAADGRTVSNLVERALAGFVASIERQTLKKRKE